MKKISAILIHGQIYTISAIYMYGKQSTEWALKH